MVILSLVRNDSWFINVPEHRRLHDRAQISDINVSHKNRVLKKTVEWSVSMMANSSPVQVVHFRKTHNETPKALQTSSALLTPSSWKPLPQ